LKKTINEDEIICDYKDKGQITYLIYDNLADLVFDNINTGTFVVVCLNKKENVLVLTKEWNKFIKNNEVKILFVNPELNKNWSINPSLHNKFCDTKNLKMGLLSLFEQIPEVK